MTLQEIDNLLLADYEESIISQIKKNNLYILQQSIFEGESVSEEERQAVIDKIISQTEIDAEFQLFKDKLRDIELERLRVEDLKTRISKIVDSNAAHNRLNPNVPNSKSWTTKNITKNSDHTLAESNLVALETADQDIQNERKSIEYKALRRQDYPSIPDQLDLIYHQGIENWKTEIKVIKDKYPKP